MKKIKVRNEGLKVLIKRETEEGTEEKKRKNAELDEKGEKERMQDRKKRKKGEFSEEGKNEKKRTNERRGKKE